MHYYAQAGIPRYLIVDPEGPVLELYKLDGGQVRTRGVGAAG